MSDAPRPMPVVTVENQPFFAAAKDGRLLIQKCGKCGRSMFYPRVACPYCFAVSGLEWIQATGRGEVVSFCFVHRPQHPVFLPDVPIPLVAVRLQEGPVLLSVVRSSDRAQVKLGLPVSVEFDQIADEIFLPVWRPSSEV